jgi:hypothetical protein
VARGASGQTQFRWAGMLGMSRTDHYALSDSHLPAPVSSGQIGYLGIMQTRCGLSYRLNFDDAVQVWLRHWNGEYQNRIAANFDVNPGRVNEVLKEHFHSGSREAASKKRTN